MRAKEDLLSAIRRPSQCRKRFSDLNPNFKFFPNRAAIRCCDNGCRPKRIRSRMSNARLQEIALLPLDQRAAHIARLFAEGAASRRRRARRRSGCGGERWRAALGRWAHPRRLPLALIALAALAGERAVSAAHAPRRARPTGFAASRRFPMRTRRSMSTPRASISKTFPASPRCGRRSGAPSSGRRRRLRLPGGARSGRDGAAARP